VETFEEAALSMVVACSLSASMCRLAAACSEASSPGAAEMSWWGEAMWSSIDCHASSMLRSSSCPSSAASSADVAPIFQGLAPAG